MSFGKRNAGEGHPARQLLPPTSAPNDTPASGVRTKVASQGGIDKGFIAVALGVVMLSAGAALAAPSVLSLFGAPPPRPIETVIAGLSRDEIKTALAQEAFPDEEGRAFMAALAQHYPSSYTKLLGDLADAAEDGADRDGLVFKVNLWGTQFGASHLDDLSRSGPEGFDAMLDIVDDALTLVEKEAGGCTLQSLERLMTDPNTLMKLTAYGGGGYKAQMRASRLFVEHASRGRNAPVASGDLNANDMNALQSTFVSMMSDRSIMNLAMAASSSGGFSEDLAAQVDVCQLGRTVMVRLESLPAPTKGRLLAAIGKYANPARLNSLQASGAPYGGLPPGLDLSQFGFGQ